MLNTDVLNCFWSVTPSSYLATKPQLHIQFNKLIKKGIETKNKMSFCLFIWMSWHIYSLIHSRCVLWVSTTSISMHWCSDKDDSNHLTDLKSQILFFQITWTKEIPYDSCVNLSGSICKQGTVPSKKEKTADLICERFALDIVLHYYNGPVKMVNGL